MKCASDMTDWNAVAAEIVRLEAQRAPLMRPPLLPALFRWRDEWHHGGLQGPIVPSEPEIVLVTKTTRAVPQIAAEAILAVQPDRMVLDVDAALDFIGRLHVLRRVDNRLERMTPAQTLVANEVMARTKVVDVYP